MTPDQSRRLHQALLNYFKPLRTPGAKIKDALDHAKASTKESPGANRGSNSLTEINYEKRPHFIPPDE